MSPTGAEEVLGREQVDYLPDESRKRRPTFEVSLSDESDSESEAARRSPSSSSSRGQATDSERPAQDEAPRGEAEPPGQRPPAAPAEEAPAPPPAEPAAHEEAPPPPVAEPAAPEMRPPPPFCPLPEQPFTVFTDKDRPAAGEPPAQARARPAERTASPKARLLPRGQLQRDGGAAYRRLMEKMGQSSDQAEDQDSARGGSQSSTARPLDAVPFKAAPRALKRRIQDAEPAAQQVRLVEGRDAVPKGPPRLPPPPRAQPPPPPPEHRFSAAHSTPAPPPPRGEGARQRKRPAPQPRGSAAAASGGPAGGAKRAREICVSSGDEGSGEGGRGPGVAQGLRAAALGLHRVASRANWSAGRRRTDRQLGYVHPGALVEVLEIVHDIEDRRVRGRVRYGGIDTGWISLQSSDGGLLWVERVGDKALRRAQEEFAAQEERHRVEEVDGASEQEVDAEGPREPVAGGAGDADGAASVEIVAEALQEEQDQDDYVALLAGRMAAAEAHWAESRLAEELAVAAPPPPEASEEPATAAPPPPEASEHPTAPAEPDQAGACDGFDDEAEQPEEAEEDAGPAAQEARSPSWDEDEDEEFVGLQEPCAAGGAAGSGAAAEWPRGHQPEAPLGRLAAPPLLQPPAEPPRPRSRPRPAPPPPPRPSETAPPHWSPRRGGGQRLAWVRCGMVPPGWGVPDADLCELQCRGPRAMHPGPEARGTAECGMPVLRRLFGGICMAPQHVVDGEFQLSSMPSSDGRGLYSLPQPCGPGDLYGHSDAEDSADRWQDQRPRPSYRKRLSWTAALLSAAAMLALAREWLPTLGGLRITVRDSTAAGAPLARKDERVAPLARKLVLPPAAGGPRVGAPPPSGGEEPMINYDCGGLSADAPQACSADDGGTLALAVLQATWTALDTEGDGRIGLAELHKAHRHVSKQAVEALFDGDTDGNGQLSRGEFVAALAGHARAGRGQRRAPVPPMVRAAMAVADSNADGALDLRELHYVQHELGLSEAACDLLIGEDHDDDGRLSAAELGAALARACTEAGAGALGLASEMAAAVHEEGGEALPWWLQADIGGPHQALPRSPQARATWCCEHAGVGCASAAASDQVPAAAAAAHEPARRAPAPPSGRTGALGGTTQYDCEEFYSAWQTAWSASKKRWCCQEHGRGCDERRRPAPGPPAPTPSAPLSYDCVDGWFDWQRRWSPAQRSWCCAAFGQGCPPGRPDSSRAGGGEAPAAGSAPFHCDRAQSAEDAATGWSLAKQEWCCRFHGLGCTARVNNTKLSPFNCESGLWEYQTGWSLSKRTWCCRHRGLGCPDDSGAGAPRGRFRGLPERRRFRLQN